MYRVSKKKKSHSETSITRPKINIFVLTLKDCRGDILTQRHQISCETNYAFKSYEGSHKSFKSASEQTC